MSQHDDLDECPFCGETDFDFRLNRQEIAQEFARIGGKSKSRAKSAAARKNAKKGGWPKGRPRKQKGNE